MAFIFLELGNFNLSYCVKKNNCIFFGSFVTFLKKNKENWDYNLAVKINCVVVLITNKPG